MSNTVLSFNERELTILSDGLLTMIENAGQAKHLVYDSVSHNAIDTHIKELQALNNKICHAGIR